MGSRKVFLPCINKIVSLLVIKGFGQIPMMLLTNIEINAKKQKELHRIFSIYRARWKCEEWIRYIKQEYNLEDIRCLNYKAIKNVVSSSFNNYSASFEPTTYISKIGVYDEDGDLIAVANLATPVKKTTKQDYTFKLKLDL